MKKFLALFLVTLILFACSTEKEGNMIIQGEIKGLKKGKLYLQKVKDTLLVTVDSINLKGRSSFKLVDDVNSPIVYYLTLSDNNTQKSLMFFGEKGTITINDKVNQFGIKPSIKGSKNQELLEQYIKVKKRFQNERLELIKKNFNATKNKNNDSIKIIDKLYKKLIKRRVLYATNFAISNVDREIAPYIGLTEMYDASFKMLDTISKSLTPKIKSSYYGKKFETYVEEIKKAESK